MLSNRSDFLISDFSPTLRKTQNISRTAGKLCSSSTENRQAVVEATGSSRPVSRILAA